MRWVVSVLTKVNLVLSERESSELLARSGSIWVADVDGWRLAKFGGGKSKMEWQLASASLKYYGQRMGRGFSLHACANLV